MRERYIVFCLVELVDVVPPTFFNIDCATERLVGSGLPFCVDLLRQIPRTDYSIR